MNQYKIPLFQTLSLHSLILIHNIFVQQCRHARVNIFRQCSCNIQYDISAILVFSDRITVCNVLKHAAFQLVMIPRRPSRITVCWNVSSAKSKPNTASRSKVSCHRSKNSQRHCGYYEATATEYRQSQQVQKTYKNHTKCWSNTSFQ